MVLLDAALLVVLNVVGAEEVLTASALERNVMLDVCHSSVLVVPKS